MIFCNCRRLPPVTVPESQPQRPDRRPYPALCRYFKTDTKNKPLPHVLSRFYFLYTIIISLLKVRFGTSSQVVEIC